MEVANEKDFTAALARVKELSENQGVEAVRDFIATCQGTPSLILQLQAAAHSTLRGDRPSLLEAEAAWRELGPESSAVAFQLASTLQNLVELRARDEGRAAVVEHEAERLRETRLLYEKAGYDEDAEPVLRIQSWVNLGNAFDFMGRDVDALLSYGRAIALDPAFGMALGNYGMTLLGIAPFMGGHQGHVLADAVLALDRALEDEERVVEIGGPSALATFRSQRAAIQGSGRDQDEVIDHSRPNFTDPHLRWAYRHGLLLHISPECLQDDDQVVDPLHLGTMTVGIDDVSQARLKRLQDAFNAVKQDYISARYSLWLASEPESPIRTHAQKLSARGRFVDTLGYARWGVQTGMALGALNVATNTLDKIAGLTHLYFDTGRKPNSAYFNGMWKAKSKKGEPPRMQSEFKAELKSTGNRGLLALCALSLDVAGEKRETELKKLVGLRNTSTHRFLVAHDMVVETKEGGWMERVEWSRLLEAAIRQLAITRAALLYLARAIAVREKNRKPEGKAMPLPNWDVEDFDSAW
jgi:tetratricopeptide (TPR) repeat protein